VERMTHGCPVLYNGTNEAQKRPLRLIYFKQIRIILRDFRIMTMNRNASALTLNILNLDQLIFWFPV